MRPFERMRPGQTWQRIRVGNGGAYRYFEEPVTLVKRLTYGGERWLVLDLTTGVTRSERFTTRDRWRRVV